MASTGKPVSPGGGSDVSGMGGVFEKAAVGTAVGLSKTPPPGAPGRKGVSESGLLRSAPEIGRRLGKGPIPDDPRKFRYDRNRARAMPAVDFGASRVDRMDAREAGDVLDRIHQLFGIDRESEDMIAAFDKALFFEHTVNGASMLQAGRGYLSVGDATFEISAVKALLGVDQRRFFRAFSDDITAVNRDVLAALDFYNPASVEKHGQLMQVAVERGLQKYPHLAHDSSDAGLLLSVEERVALMSSKRLVLMTTENNVDKMPVRA